MRTIALLALLPTLAAADPVPPPAPAAAAATAPATKRDKKPPVALVLPGTRRVLGFDKVKPYGGSELDAEPGYEPSEVKVVEILGPDEVMVLVRPWSSPLLGAMVPGARVAVRGVLHAKSGSACAARLWYAVEPSGWLCSRTARPTAEAPTKEAVLQVPEGERLPFHYVMVGVKEGDKLPMWAELDDARRGSEPERQLEKGDTVAVAKTVKIDGVAHYVSVEGKVLPVRGTFGLSGGSEWHGEPLDDKTTFPFGWATVEAKVFADATGKRSVDLVQRRTRVAILEEAGAGGRRMLRIGENRWLRAGDVNEVRKIARPEGLSPAKQWIDVDLGEQVLVAYEEERPVYATLTSSGRAVPTPRGNYPVWAKVSSISMKSQPYDDKAYFVNKVPWVLFFQAHNAIHGAYWHDRFGVTKSHGCINVSPLDARHLFEWLAPPLPGGWSGFRAPDLLASPTVHVHNSHMKRDLLQERPIGPPDKELEAQKLEAAEERRAQAGTAPEGMKP